jgi:RNA polymerase sigma-70 factor (ECF subfamily)
MAGANPGIIPLRPMPDPEATWDSTLTLLTRARNGDAEALNDLFARYLPGLRRWASGRLPRWARDLADTPDVVQEVLLETFKRIDGFDHRGEGALRAYLRQAVMNRIREELRRANRRPVRVELDESLVDAARMAVGRALLKLSEVLGGDDADPTD